jgi:hypothetical protein
MLPIASPAGIATFSGEYRSSDALASIVAEATRAARPVRYEMAMNTAVIGEV